MYKFKPNQSKLFKPPTTKTVKMMISCNGDPVYRIEPWQKFATAKCPPFVVIASGLSHEEALQLASPSTEKRGHLNKAFTLIEFIAVLAVIGLVFALVAGTAEQLKQTIATQIAPLYSTNIVTTTTNLPAVITLQ